MTKIKYYLCKNRVSISSKKKMKKDISETRGNEDEINMVCGLSWEGLEGVKEIMESALEFSIRPHSFQALVMLRVMHKNNLPPNPQRDRPGAEGAPGGVMQRMLATNNIQAVAGQGPLVY